MDSVDAMMYAVYKDMMVDWTPSPVSKPKPAPEPDLIPPYKPITIYNAHKLNGTYKVKNERFEITYEEEVEFPKEWKWKLERYLSDNIARYIGYISISSERDAFGRLILKRGLPSYTEVKTLPIESVRDMNNIKDLILGLYE